MTASKQKIRDFIQQHADQAELGDDVDIFESGLVTSMFVMQLVLFVEQEFGLRVSGNDLRFDAFRTVDAIAELVARKRSER